MNSNLDYIFFDYTFQPTRRRRRASHKPQANSRNPNQSGNEWLKWIPLAALLLQGINLLIGNALLRPDPKVFHDAASARFVQIDTTTGGNWKGTYGGDGYNIVNEAMSLPSNVNVKVSGHSARTWTSSTTDNRAPESVVGSDRVAARWESQSGFTVDIEITDGQPRRMALYALDWDGNNRSQRIDVIDAATNTLLDSRSISSFYRGQYLVWDLNGHVKIRVNRTGAKTAVISGLYSKLIA